MQHQNYHSAVSASCLFAKQQTTRMQIASRYFKTEWFSAHSNATVRVVASIQRSKPYAALSPKLPYGSNLIRTYTNKSQS